jgi:thiamine-phosphate pyrophosphorylase
LHRVTKTSYKDLIAARESANDVGRKIKESSRATVESVISANLRRAQEAVRVLEEYSKVFSKKAAPELKKIRYQLYQYEKRAIKKL